MTLFSVPSPLPLEGRNHGLLWTMLEGAIAKNDTHRLIVWLPCFVDSRARYPYLGTCTLYLAIFMILYYMILHSDEILYHHAPYQATVPTFTPVGFQSLKRGK